LENVLAANIAQPVKIVTIVNTAVCVVIPAEYVQEKNNLQ
jgi:hypothetical protein